MQPGYVSLFTSNHVYVYFSNPELSVVLSKEGDRKRYEVVYGVADYLFTDILCVCIGWINVSRLNLVKINKS